MISCSIIKSSDRQPLDGFIEGTTRFVCVPDIDHALVSVLVETPCYMQVRIDEEDVFTTELDPRHHLFALKDFVVRSPEKSALRSRLWPGRAKSPELATEFSIVLRLGGRHGKVLGTYEYSLLSCATFEDRFNHHLHIHDSTCGCRPEFFTTDARASETAINCWNCHTPVKPGHVCRNCGCDQDDF